MKVLLALAVGIALGAWAAHVSSASFASTIDIVGILGTMWINAIRMTVIPLVASLTVASVASLGDARHVGRIGGVALLVFLALLVTSGFWAVFVTPFSLDHLALPADAAANLRASFGAATSAPAPQVPSLTQRLIEILPVNPVKAAVDGAILPVVVFALAIGLALSRVAANGRDAVIAFCRAISDAMLVLVGWVLRAAPVGVFSLALVLGFRAGAASAAALVHYMVTLSAVMFAYTLVLYPIAVVLGRVSPRAFAGAALPGQAVAFGSRSSLAALPAMIAGMRDKLTLAPSATGFVLPLAVSVFRINVPMAWVVGVIFLGKLYGVPVTEGQLAMLVVTSTLLSFSVPGIPSGSLFLLAPVLVQNGIPAEGVGVLIALDAIPDMFKTLANVTAHMTSTVVTMRFTSGATTQASTRSTGTEVRR